MSAEITAILDKHGRLATPAAQLNEQSDLYAAGLDSLGVVNVMLAIEAEYGIEFPDSLMSRRTFSSIAAIDAAVQQAQAA